MTINPLQMLPPKGFGHIYKITSPDGRSYIGKTMVTVANKITMYAKNSHSKNVANLLDEYGKEKLDISILGTYHKSDLNEAKIYFIEEYDSICNGYNKHCEGYKIPPKLIKVKCTICGKTFEKLSRRKKVKTCSEECLTVLRKRNAKTCPITKKGRIFTEEEKRKLSIASKKRWKRFKEQRKIDC